MLRVRVLIITAAIVGASLAPSAQQGGAVARATTPMRAIGRAAATGATIQGSALTATNNPLRERMVRLRDARFGRIVDTTITDRSGLFIFSALEPGSYVVELVGAEQTVLAASQIVNVNADEEISAVVKLPFEIPPFGGVLGHSSSTAGIVALAAAASGLLATEVAGQDVSPRR
jgi:hypothetical protein